MQQHASVFDTLVYLFDYLVYEKKSPPTVDEVHQRLGAAGFAKKEIDTAMTWLLDLNDLQESEVIKAPSQQSIRFYTTQECENISSEGQACLNELVALGVISTRLREIVIIKLMTLEEMYIGAEEVKWVALMALYNREGQEASAMWLERSLWEDTGAVIMH